MVNERKHTGKWKLTKMNERKLKGKWRFTRKWIKVKQKRNESWTNGEWTESKRLMKGN